MCQLACWSVCLSVPFDIHRFYPKVEVLGSLRNLQNKESLLLARSIHKRFMLGSLRNLLNKKKKKKKRKEKKRKEKPAASKAFT